MPPTRFLGTYSARLDEKGRIVLPARLRGDLGSLVMTRGQERTIYVFTAEEFDRRNEELSRAHEANKDLRHYGRLFLASADEQVLDRQGRVTIREDLRRYAGLERDCVVIGTGPRMEIWDAQRWADYLGEQESRYSELDAAVMPSV